MKRSATHLFTIVLLLTSTYLKAQLIWQNVGGAGFTETGIDQIVIAFNNQHTPYVAYTYSGPVSVRKYVAGTWQLVGQAYFSDSVATYLTMAIAPDGTPYVAFEDQGMDKKASVMKFDGNTWSYVGVRGFSPDFAASTSIAIDSSGVPYVGFVGYGNPGSLEVMKFDGNSWVNVGSPYIYNGNVVSTALKIDPHNIPFVAFSGAPLSTSQYKATVMKFVDTAWTTAGNAGFSQSSMDMTSLAFDTAGNPYVAYREYAPDYDLTVMGLSGNIWQSLGTDITGNFIATPSIAVDMNGTPYVAFTDYSNGLKTSVLKYNSGWHYVGTAGFSSGRGFNTSLAIDQNIPYVAFEDRGEGPSRVMKYDTSCGINITGHTTGIACGGGNNAKINVFATGTNLVYTLTGYRGFIDTNSTGHFNSLAPNLYLETVSNGTCVQYGSYDSIISLQGVVSTAAYNAPLCLGSTLQLSSTAVPATNNTYLWNGPNGFVSQSADTTLINPTFADTGTYRLIVTGYYGCRDTEYTNVQISVPVFDTMAQTICAGSVYAGHNTTGTFHDVYTGANGCDSTRTLHLTVTPAPTLSLSKTICEGDSYHGYTTTGNYQYLINQAGNCDTLQNLALTVLPNPVPVITTNGDTLITDTTGVNTYIWYYNNAIADSTHGNILVALQNGYYHVLEEKHNGCSNISDSVLIENTGMNSPGATTLTLTRISGSNFIIKSNGASIESYSIYTSVGQLLRRETIASYSAEIDMQHEAKGTYMLYIKVGDQYLVKKFVVVE